jgi:oligosaccharide repeat unit polymerase
MYTLLFFISTIIAFIILIRIQPIDHRTIFEPKVLILGLFSLCYLVPTLAIVLGADILQIDDLASIELLSKYGFLFVLSFIFFNKVLKRFPQSRGFSEINVNIYWSPKKCFIGYFLIFTITKIILKYYGVGESEEYTVQYLVRASIPTIIAQSLNLLQSMQWIFIYLLLASSFNYSTRKYSLRFIGLLFFVLFMDMWFTNSRSTLVSFTIVFMATYAFYNRPIGLTKEISFSILFILIMGVFSLKRMISDEAISFDLLSIMIPSEFIFVYNNALHLTAISVTPEFVQPPGSSYLQALFAFIPQQFNAGKWDPATWYVGEYFAGYAAAGGGLAFGIIPEAIINWGLISIVFQALIIVIIFRIAYSYAYRNQFLGSNVWVVFYLFCISQIYQVVRNHSFSIISSLGVGFVVPFLLLLMFNRIGLRWRHHKNV